MNTITTEGQPVTITTRICPFCSDRGSVTISRDEAQAIYAGGLVHQVLAHEPRAVREQLISGIHPACWDDALGADEDDQ